LIAQWEQALAANLTIKFLLRNLWMPCAACCATQRSTQPSRSWCSRCHPKPTLQSSLRWWTHSASMPCAKPCASSWPCRCRPTQPFRGATNMTARSTALTALVASGSELATPALARFHTLFKDEPLVIDKWFALQAGAPDRGGNVLPAVRQLMAHPDFSLKNPNRARSVIFSYCSANPGAFHRSDAAGYVFWSDRVIELDAINPQVAARLARALDRWKKLADPWRSAAREAIARVAAKPDLSNDVREVVTRALAE